MILRISLFSAVCLLVLTDGSRGDSGLSSFFLNFFWPDLSHIHLFFFTGFKCSDDISKSLCLPDNYVKFELPHKGNTMVPAMKFSPHVSFYPQIRQTRLAFPWTSTRWCRSTTRTTASPSPCTSMSIGRSQGSRCYPHLGLPPDLRTLAKADLFPQTWSSSRTCGCPTYSSTTWRPSKWSKCCQSFPDCGSTAKRTCCTARPPKLPSCARWGSTCFPSTLRPASSELALTPTTAQKCISSPRMQVKLIISVMLLFDWASWFQAMHLWVVMEDQCLTMRSVSTSFILLLKAFSLFFLQQPMH